MDIQELKRIGNFIFSLEGEYLVCSGVSGSWRLCWRDDSEFYGVMMTLLKGEELVDEYVRRLVASYYIHTTHAHDWLVMVNGGVPMTDGKGKAIKVDGVEQKNFTPFLFGYMQLCSDAVERESKYIPQDENEEDVLDREELLQSIDDDGQ